MGSAYWQVNDTNPVISWSGIDYNGRWKALHYAARRFYAPVLLSCDDTDPMHPALYVTNDTPEDADITVKCRLRLNTSEVLREFTAAAKIPALSAAKVLTADISDLMSTAADRRTKYLEYELISGGTAVSCGTTLFVRPKEFMFPPVKIKTAIADRGGSFAVTLTADNFAKSVCLSLKDYDCIFSDNWFDIHGGTPVTVTFAKPEGMTAEELRGQLEIRYY